MVKRSGFTLVELIFVIVIIGVLAAAAIPKFTELKLNAEITNIIKPYSSLLENGKAAYLNEVELNDKNSSDVALTDLIELKGKGWEESNSSYYSYVLSGNEGNMSIEYKGDGTVEIVTTLKGSNKATIKTKLNKRTGMIFGTSGSSEVNTTVLDFTK